MWLIITVISATIATLLWKFSPKNYRLDILSLMLWGASIMILVDHIIGYEGGEFFEITTEGLITNSSILGIIMLIPVFIVWGGLLLRKKPIKSQ